MAAADRDEASSLRRLLRLAQLRREVEEAEGADRARQRLELQLRIDTVRYRSLATGGHWRAA